MLIIVIGANLTASAYLSSHTVNRGITRVWQKWQLAGMAAEPVDWLVLGDSTCGQGIRPDVLEQELGGSALNLCTVANATLVNDAWLLQHYISRVGPPRSGVIVFHALHGWNRDVSGIIDLLDQIPLAPGFWREMQPRVDVTPARELRLRAAPLTTLYDRHLSVSHLLQIGAKQAFGSKKNPRLAADDLKDIMREKGWVGEHKAMPEKSRRDSARTAQTFSTRPFELSPANHAAIEAIAKAAKAHNFQLFLSHSSISEELAANAGIQRFLGEASTRLTQIAGQAGHGSFVLQPPPAYPAEQMDSEDHVVGPEVARDLTVRLAAAIRMTKATPNP